MRDQPSSRLRRWKKACEWQEVNNSFVGSIAYYHDMAPLIRIFVRVPREHGTPDDPAIELDDGVDLFIPLQQQLTLVRKEQRVQVTVENFFPTPCTGGNSGRAIRRGVLFVSASEHDAAVLKSKPQRQQRRRNKRGEGDAPTPAPAAEQAQATTTPAAAAPPQPDVSSLMQKMAEQTEMINKLNEQLQVKQNDVAKLTEKQRAEMQHIYESVMKQWIDSLETPNEKSREEFKTGLQRLAQNADRENGIWEVVMCASSIAARDRENAIKKETEFQELQKRYDDLNTRYQGGQFISEDSRVGSKRAAVEEPHPSGGAGGSMWDSFSDMMKTSYSNENFMPSPNFTQQQPVR